MGDVLFDDWRAFCMRLELFEQGNGPHLLERTAKSVSRLFLETLSLFCMLYSAALAALAVDSFCCVMRSLPHNVLEPPRLTEPRDFRARLSRLD